ncbi:Cytochrome P450 [Micromonospora purpureochromogenes]|uniref:Cytochrome P450 n=1 Tax=Micromonospora purpureochromogenes TaxID=47872 RepID=A0A1C4Y8P6_9ACTN|nr:cytochrome P450 [Micromonospora purpureochromogenes]SCF17040.1 Cytochrome P450 [Micromonospora purpureochromogenes]
MSDPTPLIPPGPDTPACGPPTLDGGVWSVTRHADVCAVLTDPDFRVPEAASGPPDTLAWLRGTVARFSGPDRHPARRAAAVAALADCAPDGLRRDAARLTAEELDRDPLAGAARLARGVPLRVLAARLGLADPAAVPAVTVVAAAYQPGAGPAAVRRADRAVAALVAMSPAGPPETLANRIGLLVQACAATAALIDTAARYAPAVPPSVPTAALLAEVLRLDPPVRATRRIAVRPARVGGQPVPPGAELVLRFDAANRDPAVVTAPDRFAPGRSVLTFGAGPHGCPGEQHALALAAGVVNVLRQRPGTATRPELGPARTRPAVLR